LIFAKSRDAAPPGFNYTIVQSGDNLGQIDFTGGNGTNTIAGASIQSNSDGSPSSTAMPGRLSFWTTPSGTNTRAERMRISASGGVSIGTTTDPGAAGVVNVLTGFRIGNAAASGHFLRGNGTNYVDNTLQVGDLGTGAASHTTLIDVAGTATWK